MFRNKLQVLFLACGLALAGCASQPLTLAQVRGLTDINLCLQPAGAPFVAQEIKSREVNCARIVRDNVARQVKEANVSELCGVWYRRGAGDNMDLVDREVKKRHLDCADVVQKDRQIMLMEQQNSIMMQGMMPRMQDCYAYGRGAVHCTSW